MEVVFKSIYKRYGQTTAVHDLNLTIEKGALHFLLGPSGCGKTTTLRMLAGLEQVTEGQLFFNGEDVTKKPAVDRGIGMVFQNYALWPHMTVYKNVEYGLKLRKLSSAEIKKRIDDVLDITRLTQYVDRLPGQLSGGQQQRVALARALAIRPNVLLLDEPLSNLDAKLRGEMRDNILRIHKQTGITTLYVTHDQREALSMGTRISVMHAGHLIQTDSPRTLYNFPKTPFIASFIGETNLIQGKVIGRQGETIQVQTALGLFEATHKVEQFPVGAAVSISMRPEAIAIDWDKKGQGANYFQLKVEHLTYLGESEQFQLRSSSGQAIKVNFYHAPEHNFQEGDAIGCMIAAEDVLVLPPQTEIGPGT
ncbi:MAG TPA: ABC transporter ATP-binding protein [Oligoflexus sp.]|uniref:ABC transporter ATP-binding protein n=1 Tax=Oligoflexus sp. TaxID=1971216 RepID=UPI002D7EE161|nr:ABC transporter ATP-binding protein [Oligoflexus sp.]HET9240206.1 ABC transporter ATP-binding protein [Oligoflexus sp.]